MLFCQGTLRTTVVDCVAQWNIGAQAARERKTSKLSSVAPSQVVLPLKVQLYNLMIDQSEEEGLQGEVLANLRASPRIAVEAVFHDQPPEDPANRGSLMDGLRVRALLSRPEVAIVCAKGLSGFSMLGIGVARFFPGPALRDVLRGSNYEELMNSIRKDKGKWSAERRGSALARDDGRKPKK